MRVFLDANILVSVLNKEYPLFSYSARILSLSDQQGFDLMTSPICLAIAFYFSQKKSGQEMARKKIGLMSSNLWITTSDKDTVDATLENHAIHDFEDGLQYYSALKSECSCIVTENIEDYYFSDIEILKSRAFLEKYL